MPESETSKTRYLFIGMIAVFALLLYGRTVWFNYSLDDDFIFQNVHVQEGFGGIGEIVTHGYQYGYNGANDLAYRPLVLMNYAIEIALFGNRPAVHHLFNVLLYAALGVVLFLLLLRMFPDRNPLFAALVTLLFLAHPVHSEVVASIKNREEILAMLFLAASLYGFSGYLKDDNKVHLGLAAGCFFLALLSKEIAFTFLAVFPLFAWTFHKTELKPTLLKSLPFFGVGAVYFAIRLAVLDSVLIGREIDVTVNTLAAAEGAGQYLATVFVIVGKYFQLLAFPAVLSWDYSFNEIPLADFASPWPWFSLLLIVGVAVGGIYFVRKRHPAGFSLLYMLITFSLVSNLFFKMGVVMAERLLFVPSLGFCIAAGLGIEWAAKSIGKKQMTTERNALIAIFGVLIFLGGTRTYLRLPDWQDKLTLFQSGVETSPNSAKTHLALASEYLRLGELETENAEKRFEYFTETLGESVRAMEIHPDFAEAYFIAGNAYFLMRDLENAFNAFNRAHQLEPKYKEALNYMGVIALEIEKYDKAKEYFDAAIAIDPEYDRPWANLGAMLSRLGRFNEAIPYLESAIRYNPYNLKAINNLANVYEDLGNAEKAAFYRAEISKLNSK